ncbi:Taf12p KNAG_0I00890 [Huiozyma naganishii CBS 8797]|uniref:TBP-associated factor 12 n=1 Tax=Huiozyma naganishii (strain ATCC MYA-139 / BCRC 22969 / CBS 8797 / KCTC 17520 / NBRC 10181 / NCYC 3082 / Yp74L-3) TaxID=1071383 RepID=J7RAI1_HUIN7|nr:hypothetical protein KNAG_0I00890 [Kazachstania naganishii CBS 8797]CCK71880.1 hypothetical protein KNAG_0I00890 [Kazachstania naganishii CBS 8797]
MADANNGNDSGAATPASPAAGSASTPQQQLVELAQRFKLFVGEAKRVGETTEAGKQLLVRAAKIKAVYDSVRGASAGAAAQSQQRTADGATGNVATAPAAAGGGGGAGNTAATQLAMAMRQALTPEQVQQYDKIATNFQNKAKSIRDKHNYLKQNIDKLTAEINKQQDRSAKQQLAEKRNELLRSVRQLTVEHNSLKVNFQLSRKNFYVECAKLNPKLQQILQRTAQQAQSSQQAQVQAQAQAQAQSQSPAAQSQSQSQPPVVPQQAQTPVPQSQSQTQLPQSQPPQRTQSNSNSSGNNSNVTGHPPSATPTVPANHPAKHKIFKESEPSVPIPESIDTVQPAQVAYKVNRPTITGGSGMNAPALNTPVNVKIPVYEADTDRVLSKRKLRELVRTVGVDEGDGETVMDGDVEQLLLDLADDFVSDVTAFACRLAKHRGSDSLEARDVQLHLERNWNIRLPGYATDEIRSTRKWNGTSAYHQKLNAIAQDRTAAAGSATGGSVTKPSRR